MWFRAVFVSLVYFLSASLSPAIEVDYNFIDLSEMNLNASEMQYIENRYEMYGDLSGVVLGHDYEYKLIIDKKTCYQGKCRINVFCGEIIIDNKCADFFSYYEKIRNTGILKLCAECDKLMGYLFFDALGSTFLILMGAEQVIIFGEMEQE